MKLSLIERLASAIKQGKFFHLFIDGEYLKSFYHQEAAHCWNCVKGSRVINLGDKK
jgi:hypothetical protein